jgi:hypothetical protein
MRRMLRTCAKGATLRRVISAAVALALASGVATVPEAWTATYYVATTGSNGNSATQAQSPATPWQTLTHALALPPVPGDVIQLQPGTYNAALGEVFPLPMISGVTIQGNAGNPSSTTISAPDTDDVFSSFVTLSSATTLSGLTITHDAPSDRVGLAFSLSSSVTMAPQVTHDSFVGVAGGPDLGIGIFDQGAGTTRGFTGLIDHNTFTDFQGIEIAGDFAGPGTLSPTISNNTFTADLVAIGLDISSSFGGTMAPLIQGNTVTGVAEGVAGEMTLSGSSGATFQPAIENNHLATVNAFDTAGAFLQLNRFNAGKGSVVFSPTVSGNTISGAATGIGIVMGTTSTDTSSAGTAATVTSNATISGNTISGAAAAGIGAAFLPLGNSPDFGTFNANWTISNNTATGPGIFGIVASTGDSSSNPFSLGNATGTMQLKVTGNAVSNYGLANIATFLPGLQAANVARSVRLQGNGSQGSGTGIGIGYGPPNVQTEDMEVRDNYLHANTGTGLGFSLIGEGQPETTLPLVRCNTITGNTLDGIVHAAATSFAVDYGSTRTSPGLNTISGNTSDGGADFANLSPLTQVAQNNYWGSPTGPVPAQFVGNVTFSPFLSAPPAVASIPLTVTVIHDVTPPGPSVGDTLRYTATITMSDTCGCAQAVFSAPIPANVTEQAGSAMTSQGTVTSENPLSVNLGSLTATSSPIIVQWDVIANAGPTVSSQGTLTCNGETTLSNDPTTTAPLDPTVTPIAGGVPIAQVPTLGAAGMAGLAGGLVLAGLFLLRRRRRWSGALLLLLLLAGGSWAQATELPRPPHPPAPLLAVLATPAGVSSQSNQEAGPFILHLADGRNIDASKVRVAVRDKRQSVRGAARIRSATEVNAALAAGAGAFARVFWWPDGSIQSITIVILDSMTAARDRVARNRSHHSSDPQP